MNIKTNLPEKYLEAHENVTKRKKTFVKASVSIIYFGYLCFNFFFQMITKSNNTFPLEQISKT